MVTESSRLSALRAEIAKRELDGFVVPLVDEHMSEYVADYARRLAWLTGFQGSAGSALVLMQKAAIFVDGRYILQVREEVSSEYWTYESAHSTTHAAWLTEHAPEGTRLGYDRWLHTKHWVAETSAALARKGGRLIATSPNPIGALWSDQPARPAGKLHVHPDRLAGKSSSEKRGDIANWLASRGADVLVLTALDSIAWTFNVRGEDIHRTPVALAFAIVHADRTAEIFVAPAKVSPEVLRHLGSEVRVRSYDSFLEYLSGLRGKHVAVDPCRTVVAIFEELASAGASVIETRDPVVLAKAIKNETEIRAHNEAQAWDGAALCRFLRWLSVTAPAHTVDELTAAETLQRFREAGGQLRDLSFDTISAAGPNAALPHYKATHERARRLSPGEIYLVDSGGQYPGATTDITRTVSIGNPTAQMKDRFTRVLKGHIALAEAIFPVGTRGFQLDILARRALWAAGLDYPTATGHGVGSYLCVHEGPQFISGTPRGEEPLAPGMILSNEPGYYKAGEYGMRIENLMLVVRRDVPGAELPMLGFETLSLVPIDRALIDVRLLSTEERHWVDAYHSKVAQIVSPLLDDDARAWLSAATRPLMQ